jgi:galactokinase
LPIVSHGSVTAFAPGRVNLIGEHTDYNGGLAVPFAIARGVTVRATTLPGPLLMARALDLGETDIFDAREPGAPGELRGWKAFLRGTVAALAADGHRVPAARVEIRGTVPRSGGLSSSAALGGALALALLALGDGDTDPDRRALARLCSRVEHEWAGAPTGLLDQYASLLGADGQALEIDFAADTVSPVPLVLDGHQLAVVASGGRRDLAASGYADKRRECLEAAQQLGVATLRDADPAAVERLGEPWRWRAEHVLSENARVEASAQALRAGDLVRLGELLDASHRSLRDTFHVSTDAVERTVARCKASGALGARMIGGGFGGYVLALLPGGARIPSSGFAVAPSAGAWVR